MKRFISGIVTFIFLFPVFQTNGQEKDPIAALAATNGRYVYGQITKFGSDQYMLDTQTGRLWQIANDQTSGLLVLRPVLYLAVDGTRTLVPEPVEEETRRAGETLRRFQQEAQAASKTEEQKPAAKKP